MGTEPEIIRQLAGVSSEPHAVMEKLTILKELAQPLVDYIRANGSPYTAIIVTGDQARIVQTECSVPFDGWD